ncbi:cytosolic 5'-nucleotidase 1B [Salarias fasciatus]|uniref:Cytosolic 5'-nucleotidase 1B-like n=1 Tax=Salarias fasciatus TaxID=181472 RepID=A0A672IZZ4_SALFA|nr:cytosolic 5'-nucleotidase 1B-like [Salarias fasciatus]
MVSTVQNTDVKQKDAGQALVVALASHAVFEPAAEDRDGVYRPGVAFPLLQALQTVNRQLLQENPEETLLFDMVLISTDSPQQQSQENIRNSTRHHGLEVGRFCFAGQEDFVGSLLEHGVGLFLSTDRSEVSAASQKGVFSALLDENAASAPSEQLRVLLCGDGTVTPSSGQTAPLFLSRLGELRRRFDLLHSPVLIGVLTASGGISCCAAALRALRAYGLEADQAHCLGGAPGGPVLAVLRPHLLLSHALQD